MKQPQGSDMWGRLVTRHETGLDDPNWEEIRKDLLVEKGVVNGQCQRCSNQDLYRFQGQDSQGHPLQVAYCRQCIQMGRISSMDDLYYLPDPRGSVLLNPPLVTTCMTWQGKLSKEQMRAAKEMVASFQNPDYPHMIHAVTGAGKTEMIFPAIDYILKRGGRVCLASPRIDVCLELAPRLQAAFEGVDLLLLYGEGDSYRYCPLLVATVHQLLRFKEAFDLLIVDEVDAFPYAGDASLHFAVQRAVKPEGKLVYLTATPDKELKQLVEKGRLKETVLPARYHGYPLPEPGFVWVGDWRKAIDQCQARSRLFRQIKTFLERPGSKLIFVPQIKDAENLYAWLKEKWPLDVVHSKDPKRKDKVQALRNGYLEGLITTTILERGVTFTNCQVYILGANDPIFNQAALVQMSGRAGRKKDYPWGQVTYAHQGVSQAMLAARREIRRMNQLARKQDLLND